jgi:hypothetical protein
VLTCQVQCTAASRRRFTVHCYAHYSLETPLKVASTYHSITCRTGEYIRKQRQVNATKVTITSKGPVRSLTGGYLALFCVQSVCLPQGTKSASDKRQVRETGARASVLRQRKLVQSRAAPSSNLLLVLASTVILSFRSGRHSSTVYSFRELFVFLNGDCSWTEMECSPFIPPIHSLPSACSLHRPKALAPTESHHSVITANIFVKTKVRPLKKGAVIMAEVLLKRGERMGWLCTFPRRWQHSPAS